MKTNPIFNEECEQIKLDNDASAVYSVAIGCGVHIAKSYAVGIGIGFTGEHEESEIILCPSAECSTKDQVLRLKADGRIFVNGRLAETDKEVVDGLRLCLSSWLPFIQTKGAPRVREAIDIGLRDGQIDGAHHKMWVIDQMLRALSGDAYNETIRNSFTSVWDEWDVGIAP